MQANTAQNKYSWTDVGNSTETRKRQDFTFVLYPTIMFEISSLNQNSNT